MNISHNEINKIINEMSDLSFEELNRACKLVKAERKKKTADEMFEELGYKRESDYYYHTTVKKRGTLKHIRFLRNRKNFVVESNYGFRMCITMQELKAINEKVKELGWL